MKVVQINAVSGSGSTGKIAEDISKLLDKKNIESYIFYSYLNTSYPKSVKYMTNLSVKINMIFSKIMGNYGFNTYFETKKLINILKKVDPDIIQIHNIHGHNINLEVFFKYLKKSRAKIVWTFHDCWAFTGYCTYFTYPRCDKWKDTCFDCKRKKEATFFFDRSTMLFNKKKQLFSELNNLTIVTPSKWLADLTKQSFLKKYPIKVINNGIDLRTFCPKESEFKKKYDIESKFVVLGVALPWSSRKGIDVFSELAKRLSEQYRIVLVGTNEEVEKSLPSNIISIHRTNNQKELAQIYSAADVFANPTREENFPTVNIEAIACGTPVVTFDTGGSSEMLDRTCGSVVDCDDIDTFEKEIIRVCEEKSYSKEACLRRAQNFSAENKFDEYVNLYEGIIRHHRG